MKPNNNLLILSLPAIAALLLATGCGSKEETIASNDLDAEIEEYYRTKVSLPPAVFEALERGEITQEEVDQRSAAGEFPKFFQFATPSDIPANLVWENGSELPDIGSPEAKKGGTLNGFVPDFPRTLRKVGPDAGGSFRPYIVDYVTVGLAHRHPEVTDIGPTGFHLFPGLATEWAVDRPNKQVYARIDPDAKWSDGAPITADDFMFTFFFMQSPHIQAPWYNNAFNRLITGITKYDDHTISIGMPEAKPDMKSSALSVQAVPRHFYSEFGPDFVERYQWKFEPTTGPYVIKEQDIDKGRSITLTRNPAWWAKDKKFWRNRFNPDRIRFSVIRDIDKAFEVFKTGQLDGFSMTLAKYYNDKLPNDAPEVQNGYIHKITFYNDVPVSTFGLRMNSAKPLLDNRDIRVGIHHATNWQLVVDKYFRGDAQRMRTSADGFGEFTNPTIVSRTYDVEKALNAFGRAGFTTRGPDGVLVNAAGQRLSFTLTSPFRSVEDMLPILKDEAAKAGLEINIEVLDLTAGYKKMHEKNHEIGFSGFGASPEMYPRYWEFFHGVNAYDKPYLPDGSPNPDRKPKADTSNFTSTAIPELDKKIDAYRASESAEEMKRLAYEMEQVIYDDAAWIPGWKQPFIRSAFWRWIRWPEGYNVKLATESGEYFLSWIDEDMKKETLEAMKSGKTFEPQVLVYDQYKEEL